MASIDVWADRGSRGCTSKVAHLTWPVMVPAAMNLPSGENETDQGLATRGAAQSL